MVEDTRPGLLRRIVDWLRAGYPEGIPKEDYVALLGILHRSLTDEDIQGIAQSLAEMPRNGSSITRDEIESMIRHEVLQTATPDDVRRVSAHLASGGWPLDLSAPVAEPEPPSRNGFAAVADSVLGWLRAGYPEGVPTKDYLPLLALLRRRLGDDEARQIADELSNEGLVNVDRADIAVSITKVTNDVPTEDDIDRVAAHLAAAGWKDQA